jgi:hypothetical protein
MKHSDIGMMFIVLVFFLSPFLVFGCDKAEQAPPTIPHRGFSVGDRVHLVSLPTIEGIIIDFDDNGYTTYQAHVSYANGDGTLQRGWFSYEEIELNE